MRYLALITSSATLLCCALPAILVTLGFGSVVASVVSGFPAIMLLSQHKLAVFGVSAALILLAWNTSAQERPCAITEHAEGCRRVKTLSRGVLLASSILWLVGFTVAFVLPKIVEP